MYLHTHLGVEQPLGLSLLRRQLLLAPHAQLLPLQAADERQLVQVSLRDRLRLALRPLQPLHLGLVPGGGSKNSGGRRRIDGWTSVTSRRSSSFIFNKFSADCCYSRLLLYVQPVEQSFQGIFFFLIFGGLRWVLRCLFVVFVLFSPRRLPLQQ